MTGFVREFAAGSRVDATLMVRSKELRVARNGDAYLSLELADRTGVIPAVLFRPSRDATEIPAGAVAHATGTVSLYRGLKRLMLDELEAATTWDPAAFVAVGPRDPVELVAEFKALAAGVTHAQLRRLIRRVFLEEGLFDRFCACPASQYHHHAYVGGLIEHTVNVAGLCAHVAERYEGVNRDLLVTAALLHDIGKVDELSVGTGISYTDEGRLVGHVVMGARRVAAAAAAVKLETRLAVTLEHALLSHHGELEWGAPKRPATIESLLLHHADNLDAKTAALSTLLSQAVRVDEAWTDADNLFRRPLYAPRPVEDDRPCVAADELMSA